MRTIDNTTVLYANTTSTTSTATVESAIGIIQKVGLRGLTLSIYSSWRIQHTPVVTRTALDHHHPLSLLLSLH